MFDNLNTLDDYQRLSCYLQGPLALPTKLLRKLVKKHGGKTLVCKDEKEMVYFIMNYEYSENISPGTLNSDLVIKWVN
jgi:hypothetical protein